MKKQLLLAGLLACMVIPFAACEKTEETSGSGASSSSTSESVADHAHTYVEHKEVTPTCDADGNELYYTCEGCDLIFDADKNEITEIPVLPADHAYVYHEEVEGSCSVKGKDAHYTCEDCEKIFDLTKNEIQSVEGSLDANRHSAIAVLDVKMLPSKVNYVVGETFDPTGMVVSYHCGDCEGRVINNQHLTYVYQTEGANVFANGDTKVTICYKGLSQEISITAGKAVAQISGVEGSYDTVCGVAPAIEAKSNLPESEVLIDYYDGETLVDVAELIDGKTYTAKVYVESTDEVEGAEVTTQVNVRHGHAWTGSQDDWRKLWYQCNCGDKADFYALNYHSVYVDEDDVAIDLSNMIQNVAGETVAIQSVQKIVRLTSGGLVDAKDGEVVDVSYTNDGMLYTFSAEEYEKLTEDYKPYVLTLSVVYKIGEIECPLIVEAKQIDMLIKDAEDLNAIAYQGGASSSAGGTSHNQYYALAGDIDASGAIINSNYAFEAALGFTGVFDGNGHTISNLNVAGGQGLFGAIGSGAKIQNVTFTNVTVNEGNYALAYCLRGVELSNVHIEFNVDSASYLVAYSANGCAFENVSVLTCVGNVPFLIDENAENALPESVTIETYAQYTVNFDTDGGSEIEAVSVTEGKTVAVPSRPTKEPSADCTYTFIGWYYNETEWDFNTPITEEITLVAKWQEKARVKASDVVAMITALPTVVTMPAEIQRVPAILEAKAAYDQLLESDLLQVINYSKLESLLAAISGYETVYVPDKYGVSAIPCHVVNNPSTVEVTGALVTDNEQGPVFVGTSGVGGRVSIQFSNFPNVAGYDKMCFYVRSSTEGYVYISAGTSNGGWGADWKNNFQKIADNYGKNQLVKDTWCLMEFDVADGYFSPDWAFGVWGNNTDYTLEVGVVIGYRASGAVETDKVAVTLDFGVRTDSGETNENGKIYNISREQYYIDTNNTNTIGTLQKGKLAAALPNGYDHFELWLYNPTDTVYNFHLAGDVDGTWTDTSNSTKELAAKAWTKVTISAEDISLNAQGQWYVYITGADSQGAAKDGWKISTVYAVKVS